jgi:adenylate kinase
MMGPPGVGKGTQATLLASSLHVPAISTGDLFRANAAASTPLGVTAKRYLDAGEYVPDHVTNGMVHDRLLASDAADGWLLDGYPRTLAQVAALDGICAAAKSMLHAVIVLEADPAELVRRLFQRAREQGRPDDTEAVIRRRQEVYRQETERLTHVYEQRGLVHVVQGTGPVLEVHQRLLDTLSAVRSDDSRG